MLFVVEEADGCFDAAALGLPAPKSPSLLRDSAARESDVTVPTLSWMGLRVDSESVVTWKSEVSRLLAIEWNGQVNGCLDVLLTRMTRFGQEAYLLSVRARHLGVCCYVGWSCEVCRKQRYVESNRGVEIGELQLLVVL